MDIERSYWAELKTDTRDLFRSAWGFLRTYRLAFLALLVLTITAALLIFPHDRKLIGIVAGNWKIPFWWYYAGELSRYGAFERATIWLLAMIWVVGFLAGRHDWRRAALATLLACALAGPTANIIKHTTGRPRPNEGVEEDRFHGPTLDSGYASFPSAHTITAMATAATLGVVFPAIAVPVVLFEGAVSFSRIYVRGHYVTDVLVGASLGITYGLLFGFACRKLNRRDERARESVDTKR